MLYVQDFLHDQKIISSLSAPSSPTVTIILPTFSRCKSGQLERSLNSVLAQGFEDFELLVMDDGSTDGSNELIERFRAKDPRIIHVRHEHNSGLPALRVNEGIELARGRYLAFQFDDDIWRKTALADLVVEAEHHSEPVVVVGRAMFATKAGKNLLPEKEVDIVYLYENNRFANNSILFPRSLVEKYGMYDPHIGMRRLTDWDLWLRMIKHVQFITIDQVVSEVFESNVGAIGLTVPWDLTLFRFLHSIPRDHMLTPSIWRDYEVDSLRIGGVELSGDIKRRVYEEQIVPYYLKIRHAFPDLGGFPAAYSPTTLKTVVFTKQSYDVSNDVTFNSYDTLADQRGSYKSYYQPLSEIKPDWVNETEMLILMRTVEDKALSLVNQAMEARLPVGLYLDDNLFTFHEYGSTFGYLAPGTPYYENLSDITRQVDAVLVTNDYIGSAVQPLNPRILPHNNTIPNEHLPAEPHDRNSGQLRIGFVGTSYRIEEFRLLWDALVRISEEYGERLVFEFWGIDVSSLPKLSSSLIQKQFTFSYDYYLESLKTANFDILLSPLLDHPSPRLGKSLIKYYETAIAGALGIFSDVPQYYALPDGLTCLKVMNDAENWYQVLHKAIEMQPAEFDLMRKLCLEHVREEFTVTGQIDLHEAALRAIEFHAKTRSKRYADGKPRVIYVLHSAHLGGAEIQLLRRLRLAMKYGIQPVVVIPSVLKDTENAKYLKNTLEREGIRLETVEYTCFTEPRSPAEFFSELERNQIRELLERCQPTLVHTVTFIPSFGQTCQEMKIPHVNTLYAVEDDFAWESGRPDFVHCNVVQSDCLRYATRWGQLLGVAKICSRDMATESLFKLGQHKFLQTIGKAGHADHHKQPRLVVTGTFQERKQQLETIEAIGHLKREGIDFELTFYGYSHFFPEYMEQCRQAIKTWELEERVFLRDFSEDIDQILADADMLLSLSTYESFPGSIKDALAAGVLVVATPVGGVSELIIDNISGILCTGTSVEELASGVRRAILLPSEKRQKIAEHGRNIARLELHPYRTANDLFRMYNMAIDINSDGQKTITAYAMADEIVPHAANVRSRVKSPSGQPSSLMPIGPGIVYAIVSEKEGWYGLDVLIETNQRPSSGELILKVSTPAGNLLRVVSTDMTAQQAGWIEMRFSPIINSINQQFHLEFTLENAKPQTLLSLYQDSPPKAKVIRIFKRFLRLLGIRLRGDQLYCRMWYS